MKKSASFWLDDKTQMFLKDGNDTVSLYSSADGHRFALMTTPEKIRGLALGTSHEQVCIGDDTIDDVLSLLDTLGYGIAVSGSAAASLLFQYSYRVDKVIVDLLTDTVQKIRDMPCVGRDENFALPGESATPPAAVEISCELNGDDKEIWRALADARNNGMPHLYPGSPNHAATVTYEFESVTQREQYSSLYETLMAALDQACNGKGKERHSDNQPFERQKMQTISDMLKSPIGLIFQAQKKSSEAMSMPEPDRQVREILGAINYLAGAIIWINNRRE